MNIFESLKWFAPRMRQGRRFSMLVTGILSVLVGLFVESSGRPQDEDIIYKCGYNNAYSVSPATPNATPPRGLSRTDAYTRIG